MPSSGLAVCGRLWPWRRTTVPPATVGQSTRRHSISAPSTVARPQRAADASPSPPLSPPVLPAFIHPRLASLRKEIVEQLAGRDRIPALMRMRTVSGDADAYPSMETLARMYFERGGKMVRPVIALLMASACNQEVAARCGRDAVADEGDVTTHQASIALIAEMIHVASLVHDDVIDEAATRRGQASVNFRWGNKLAVLAGDFILARATQALCAIGDPTVISTMATIIEDLVVGEFLQMSPELTPSTSSSASSSPYSGGGPSTSTYSSPSRSPSAPSDPLIYSDRLALYLAKSERKTASLFANSCRSVALLAQGEDTELVRDAEEYGRHVGLSFQLVDDAIDYELEEAEGDRAAGKPVAVDLELGLLTGPLLLAVQSEAELRELLQGGRTAAEIRREVRRSGACELTRRMAAEHAQRAADIASSMRSSNGASEALAGVALSQLERRV